MATSEPATATGGESSLTKRTSLPPADAQSLPSAPADDNEPRSGNAHSEDRWKYSKKKRDRQKSKNIKNGTWGNKRLKVAGNQANRDRALDEDARDPGGSKVAANLGQAPVPTFTAEEIAAEARRPKRKVAVLMGYSGAGYKGMQMNAKEKTIEGDLFAALVAAGTVSKANADDPHKISLSRCARTDKGVHAAGNVVSLKLILDPDGAGNDGKDEETGGGGSAEIDTPASGGPRKSVGDMAALVHRINEKLPPQIRVWGIVRTNNNFNCYSMCDSRSYQYLLPSYCLLPPHPASFIAKRVAEAAKRNGVWDKYLERLKDVEGFWEKIDKEEVKPILDRLDKESRKQVVEWIHADEGLAERRSRSPSPAVDSSKSAGDANDSELPQDPGSTGNAEVSTLVSEKPSTDTNPTEADGPPLSPAVLASREIKAVYLRAMRSYRVSPERMAQLQHVLGLYKGTHRFHNFTIQKAAADPSSKRHIRSFAINPPDPIIIRDTEWLSLKVHGQSFMMHQIRKMVALAALVVRCASDPEKVVDEALSNTRISIPKAPGVGLLLEKPWFEGYNKRAQGAFGLEYIDFEPFEKEMTEFREREIYKRVWESEEKENAFQSFFTHLDNYSTEFFAWVTADGIAAAKQKTGRVDTSYERLQAAFEDDDEDENPAGGDG